jgi:propanediol dehydratase large subunit
MKPPLSSILLTLLAAAALSAALSAALFANPAQQTFIGVITDSMCPKGDHSQMQMGATDADCTAACISVHGAEYVLYDGKDVYTLSDQRTPGKFAGKKVKVLGTLDAKSKKIQVDSITAEK